MSVATSTAVAIGLGAAGAATSVYGANKAANAAQTASAQQQASVNRAQDFAQQAWQQQQQALAPYRQAGNTALQNLMQTYGNQTPQDFARRSQGFVNAARMNPYGMPFPPQGGTMANPGGGMPPQQPPQQLPGGGMPPGPMQQPQAGGAPPMAMGGMPQGGLVTVQDDTGATQQVPASMAAQYQQRGFTVKAV